MLFLSRESQKEFGILSKVVSVLLNPRLSKIDRVVNFP